MAGPLNIGSRLHGNSASQADGRVEIRNQIALPVRKGETMWGIAERFGLKLNDLIKWNPQIKDPNKISPSDQLFIPTWGVWMIKPGDTLSGIAKACGTTVDALAKANQLEDPDKIVAGHDLVVPNTVTEKGASEDAPATAQQKDPSDDFES